MPSSGRSSQTLIGTAGRSLEMHETDELMGSGRQSRRSRHGGNLNLSSGPSRSLGPQADSEPPAGARAEGPGRVSPGAVRACSAAPAAACRATVCYTTTRTQSQSSAYCEDNSAHTSSGILSQQSNPRIFAAPLQKARSTLLRGLSTDFSGLQTQHHSRTNAVNRRLTRINTPFQRTRKDLSSKSKIECFR
jgi:hypothetical protein